MTREEAIEQFQNCIELIKHNGKDWLDDRDIPVLNMAIEALEIQDICAEMLESAKPVSTDGDSISRYDAIDAIDKDIMGGLNYRSILEQLPSEDRPTGEWIPCSERLPETLDDMLVTDGETMAVGYYRPDARAWDSTTFAWLENRSEPPYGIKTVVAWMPLPEPYRKDYHCKSKQKTGMWKKTKYGYTWIENNVCLNFVDYYDAKEDGNEE